MSHLQRLHPEDVKATIRKRFGSLAAFERAKKLPSQSVGDVLRGKTRGKVRAAIERMLSEEMGAAESINPDTRAESVAAHRLNAGAR